MISCLRILTFLILAMSMFVSTHAEYVPLVHDGITWRYTAVEHYPEFDVKRIYDFYFDGETTINNVSYKNLYRRLVGKSDAVMLFGYMRETDKQVFWCPLDGTEKMIYDFNSWETITAPYNGPFTEPRTAYEVEVNGNSRLMYIFDDETFIVEGIGIDNPPYCVFNPFESPTDFFQTSYALVNVTENGIAIYEGKNVNVSAIDNIEEPAGEIIEITYYNLQGLQAATPWNGINIVVTTYSNGQKTIKKTKNN